MHIYITKLNPIYRDMLQNKLSEFSLETYVLNEEVTYDNLTNVRIESAKHPDDYFITGYCMLFTDALENGLPGQYTDVLSLVDFDNNGKVITRNKIEDITDTGYQKTLDEGNCKKLLELMKDIPEDKRGALYKTHLYMFKNGEIMFQSQEYRSGRIAMEYRAGEGLGTSYDPIFILDTFNKTFGEIIKRPTSQLLHSQAAINSFIEYFKNWFETK